jgi:hypothetical protein
VEIATFPVTENPVSQAESYLVDLLETKPLCGLVNYYESADLRLSGKIGRTREATFGNLTKD